MPNRFGKISRLRRDMNKSVIYSINRQGGRARSDADYSPATSPKQQRSYIRKLIQELGETHPAARLFQSTLTETPPPEEARSDAILAHELRQPLFIMSMASESLRIALECEDVDRASMRQSVRRITEQIQRVQSLIDNVVSKAVGRVSAEDRCDVFAAATGAAHLLDLANAPDLEVSWQLSDQQMLVAMNRIELEQVFLNVLRNAKESIESRRKAGWCGAGQISITIESCGEEAHCIISDNGGGLMDSAADSVFQPFFTTKGNEGTGLGLHICRQALHNAQGTIQIVAGELEGARVDIRLPLLTPDVGDRRATS